MIDMRKRFLHVRRTVGANTDYPVRERIWITLIQPFETVANGLENRRSLTLASPLGEPLHKPANLAALDVKAHGRILPLIGCNLPFEGAFREYAPRP